MAHQHGHVPTSSSGLPSTGWLLLVQVDETYCTCLPLGGAWAQAPLRDPQALQEAVKEARAHPGAHLCLLPGSICGLLDSEMSD